jgi:hypothetical protein
MPEQPQDDVGALHLCLGQHGGHTEQLSDLTLKPWTVPVHDLPVPEAARFLAAWAAWLSEHPTISKAGHPDDKAGGGPLHG